MTQAQGNKVFVGYSQSGILGVHRDPAFYVAAESFAFTPEITEINRELLVPGQAHESIELLKGMYKCSGSLVFDLHAQEGIHFLKGIFPAITSSLLGSGVYDHQFLGSNDVPMAEGFSLTCEMDLKVYYFSGVIVTSVEISGEIDNPSKITVNWIAKKWEKSDGTAGTSQGETAVSLPVTLVASTSDQINLDIDSAGAVEVTIAAGTYNTAAELQAAINTALKGTVGLMDVDDVSEVACFVDSADKVNFYTADKGATASIAWTAGGNDAGTLLCRGVPVEAAGDAGIVAPSFSTVQPFIGHQIKVLQDGAEICAEKTTVTIDAGLIGKNCLGHKFFKEPILEKKRLVNVTIEKDYQDEAAVDAWEANSNVEVEIQMDTNTIAGGMYNYTLKIYLKRVKILNAPTPVPALGVIKQTINGQAYKHDTDYLDCRVDVQNLLTEI